MSIAPRYGFSGRASELLQIERALLRQRLVVLHGFGGVGKTALASEAAGWFIQTKMYDGACFVSFEHGGDATWLLRQLGVELNINDSHYDPNDIVAALERLEQVLAQRHLLVIADNMESILPRGDFPLSIEARTELFDVLLELKKMEAGILLTSRGTAFDDPRLAPSQGQVTHIDLGGLHPDDAYELASRILEKLSIDRALAPYPELRDLLAQLGHHPLAIHLVLPALREHSLATIKSEFATLFSQFVDDDIVTGRNRSLLASLEYSLRQLSQEQQALLLRLSPFEGGAGETSLLTITQIPEAQWSRLRNALEEAALVTAEQVHKGNPVPFLRFHPVLVPFLRSQRGSDDPHLRERYAQHYYQQGYSWYHEDNHNPEPVRALVQRELPNLRRALVILMESDKMEEATGMAEGISKFLTIFGLERERDALWKQVAEAEGTMVLDGRLTLREWWRESGLGDSELSNGDVDAATAQFTSLLSRVEALPEGNPLGRGSFEHSLTLERLAYCLRASGRPTAAEQRLRETLAILDSLLEQAPQDLMFIRQRYVALADLGEVLMAQGRYAEARGVFEESWQGGTQYNDQRHQAVVLSKVGTLMLLQEQYAEALVPFEEALQIFHSLGESLSEARLLHQLGFVAENLEQWTEAEHLYRQALAMNDLLGDIAATAMTCSQLAVVARKMGRLAEAEGWDKQALMRIEQVHPGGLEHGRYLLNFAALLCHEIEEGYTSRERLVEARSRAEQALTIFNSIDVSPETWKIQQLLAWVAELDGRTELARGHYRRAREAYAAFEGNRSQIDQQYGPLIVGITLAAQGDLQARRAIEEVLEDLENNGWPIADAVERIWSGERDWHSLTEGLDENSALLILRILEVLPHVPKARSHSADQLFAHFKKWWQKWKKCKLSEMRSGERRDYLPKRWRRTHLLRNLSRCSERLQWWHREAEFAVATLKRLLQS